MTTKTPVPPSLRRLKWTILLVSVLLISAIDAYLFFRSGSLLDHFLVWLCGVIVVFFLVQTVFRQATRLETRLDNQLADSRLQLQRQAVLIQLSLKLTPTLSEEQIVHLVTNELRHAMGYPHVELALVAQNTPVERLNPATPHYNPARLEFPLQAGGELLGTLVVESPTPQGFAALDHSFLSAVAGQAALAIANSRLWEEQRRQRLKAEERETELRDRQRSLNLLNEITQSALRSSDFATMLQTQTENLGKLFAADYAFLALWDENRNQPRLVASYRPGYSIRPDLPLDPNELGLVEATLALAQTLVIKDVSSPVLPEQLAYISPRLVRELGLVSLLSIPLITNNQKLGVAAVAFGKRHLFTQHEVHLGEQAANQIALAISKARALQSAQVRAQELDALQRATSALLTTLDQETLLGQILDAAISAIPAAEQGALHLIARDTGQLQLRAVQGHADPRIRAFNLQASSSHTARAVQERRPLLINDIPPPVGGTNPPHISNIAATIIAPLILGEQILGAIALDSTRQGAFTQADLDLLVSFAATATTAIQNAQLHAEVQKQAITDTLTGYYNRRGFTELGRREVERALRFGRPLSAMMLDIDQFKQVNDVYGHLAGDRVLVTITSRCAQELRQIDLLGRYGGDEFIVLLPETSLENASHAAERLRATIAAMPFRVDDQPVHLTISVGVAALGENCKTLEALVEAADHALYQAKEGGRNRVVVL